MSRTTQITPIVLAGGCGSRLWPLSRTDLPKQFCTLGGTQSLYQDTLSRFNNPEVYRPTMVVTNTKHSELATSQAADMGISLGALLCEPAGRNTAAAIALASYAAPSMNMDDLLLVLPSDNAVGDLSVFQATIQDAANLCRDFDTIVTIGIKPTRPACEFGYIKSGEPIGAGGHTVDRFVEKPPVEMAHEMLAEGGWCWNAGVFLAQRGRFIAELLKHAPLTMEWVEEAYIQSSRCGVVISPCSSAYKRVPSIAFDHAVMEKTDRAAVISADPGWTDLGSFSALYKRDLANADPEGNVVNGDVVLSDAKNCLAISQGKLVAVAGVEDVAVIATEDAVLVTSCKDSQAVKPIVEKLSAAGRKEVTSHSGEDRPWGRFDSVDNSKNHQVKRIRVAPKGRLSLQYHRRRAEHWIVISGHATVRVGNRVSELSVGEHVHIPKGTVHRLENRTDEPLELIEVQYGTYFGEDDIVRLSDVYGRTDEIRSSLVA